MKRDHFRWGILGTARIVRKNWKAIVHTGNSIVTAVASRDLERCRLFIAERQAEAPFENAPQALGSYESLLARDDVDAVYIPLPTGLRKEWIIRAAEAGKHIVSEKPCAVSAADLRDILAACRENRVQFMDGVMFMHNRRLDRLREVLSDGASIGSIQRITSAFSFCPTEDFRDRDIRLQSALEPSGCLGDLGWYCIRFALWVMNWQLPRAVTGHILSELAGRGSPAAVPLGFCGELFFESGVSAGFHCSFTAANQQWAVVSGAKGYVRVPDFVAPVAGNEVAYEVNYVSVRREESGLELDHQTTATAQETNLFRNFANQVRSGQINEAWQDMALKTQQVTDACLASAREDGRVLGVQV